MVLERYLNSVYAFLRKNVNLKNIKSHYDKINQIFVLESLYSMINILNYMRTVYSKAQLILITRVLNVAVYYLKKKRIYIGTVFLFRIINSASMSNFKY